MSTNDLLTDVSSCTEFINQYLNTDMIVIKECWKNCLEMYIDFVEKINVIHRVLLNAISWDEIHLMQIQLRENLESLKHYHNSTLRFFIERLSQFNESLKIKADGIKRSISQTDPLFIEQHSISHFIPWVEEIQASQHNLYMKMNYTMNWILEISNQYEQSN